MESITYLRNIKVAPKKLRFFTMKIKKMKPAEVVKVLRYGVTQPEKVFYKAINSAVANAKQTLKVSDDLLQFRVLLVEEGQRLKRYKPGSRGTAKPFARRFSHIKIVLTSSAADKVQSANTAQIGEKTKEAVNKTESKKTEQTAVSVQAPSTKTKTGKKDIKEVKPTMEAKK